MRSTLDELIAELAELQALVASMETVNRTLAEHGDEMVLNSISIRRRCEHAAFVVALYAFFETFVENLVVAYIRLEAKRVPYGDLPEGLTTKHLLGTADFLRRGRLGAGRYVGMSPLGWVKNLFECLNGDVPYSLNEAAIAAHDTNLRAREVDELFRLVGVENVCERVCRVEAMVSWYAATHESPTAGTEPVKRTVLEERLRDIVERRNEVAHRGGSPGDLLGAKGMADAVGFVTAFARSLFAIIVGRYLSAHRVKTAIELKQREDDGPFLAGRVVIVDRAPERLFAGQPVFVVGTSDEARWGRIQCIKVDNVSVSEVDETTNAAKGIGIQVDFKCPAGAVLYALAAEDDLVWSPPPSAAGGASI